MALIAPSGPLEAARIARGVARLESWGLSVRQGGHLHDRHHALGYLAGDDHDRAADLMTAWTAPDVDAVWCARGGYGAQRMVDLLDFDALRSAGPKHLVGFSDITALHTRIGRELDQVTVHGPVGTGNQFDDEPSTVAVWRLLSDRPAPGAELITGVPMIPGRASGRLIGGNLALIASDIGIEPAPSEPSVLILEDVGEEAYRLDRLLTQLRRSHWLDNVAGVVLGDFTDADDRERTEEVLHDRIADLGIPAIYRAAFGHADRNIALPLGAVTTLDANAGTLSIAGTPEKLSEPRVLSG